MTASAELGRDGVGVVVIWSDGLQRSFGWSWLRDSCRCQSCVRPGTSQRTFELCAVAQPVPEETAVGIEDDRVVIAWAPEGHLSRYPLQWLRAFAEGATRQPSRSCWFTGWDLRASAMPFESLTDDRAVVGWMTGLVERGLAMVSGGGCGPEVCEALVARFGYVRETNYGRTFDVESVASAANLAYTDLGLGLHTDNPYRDPVPTLQVLHCRVAAERGGDSVFADGLGVASTLRDEDRGSFEVLAGEPVPWRYTAADVDLAATAPVIGTDWRGEPVTIRWNERSRQPLPGDPVRAERHLEALRRFGEVLSRPGHHVSVRLEPGDLVVFDNQRVLHGRTPVQGDIHRLLTGCYADRDGLSSRLAVLSRR